MKKNVTNFLRYLWVKNTVRNHLVGLGYSTAEIRVAVLLAIKLIAQGHNAARAFSAGTYQAGRLRAEARPLPF